MTYRMIYFTGMAIILLMLVSLGNARKIPSELKAGRVFGAPISKSDYDILVDYARAPRSEMSAQILDIIKSACPPSTLEGVDASKHFVIFMAMEGIHQIVYIHDFTYRAFFVPYKRGYINPGTIRLHARNVFAIWITDNADDFLTSVEVDISKLTRSTRLASFESPAPLRKYIDVSDTLREIEIGIKYFKIPFHPASIVFTFVRRDLDTYERRTWSRSYRGFRPLTILGEFNIGLGLFLPISDSDLRRYEIKSSVIIRKDFEETAFLTIDVDRSARRDQRQYGNFSKLLIPDFFFGIGMPMDLTRIDNNSWVIGYSWPISSDLIKFSVALHLPGNNSLSDGYRVGDTVSDLDADSAIRGTKSTFIFGISASFNSIGNLF